MASKTKRFLASIMAVAMSISLIPMSAFATDGTSTTENGDGTTTTTTTTTTTEDGKTTVTVSFETTDEDGNVVASGGSEETSWTEEDNGEEAGQPVVTVPLEPGETTSASASESKQFGDVPSNEDDTDYNYVEITETERTVTATTSEAEVTINDSATGLVGEQDTKLKGLDPVYDENDDLHINSANGQPLNKVNGEHVGKQDVFDRNYLSSQTLDYINVNGVSIWVDKSTKIIVDMVVPEGTELPEHDLLDGKTVGSSVKNWYKSNSFQTKLFPENTQYKGGAKINDIDNWYDANGNLIVTIPEEGDFRYVGTGEHSKFFNARVTVIYEKDENGNTVYDENGNPVIASIQKKDGTIITIDGVPATELPEEVSLEPIFDDYNGGRPTTFMLMDEDGNRVYAYCCDMETGVNKGAWYSVSNLEDSDYYGSEESEEHIRSIVMNGYWGTSDIPKEDGSYEMGSLENIKANLREAISSGEMENEIIQMPKVDADGNSVVDENGDPVMESKTMLELIDGLTEGEALLATQSAIWAYANGHVDALNGKDGVVVIDPDGYKWNQNPDTDSKDGEALNDYGSARVDFLYKWLIDLETEEESSVVINEKNFVEDLSLSIGDLVADAVQNKDDNQDNNVYNANLNFKLAFVPGDNDDLLVQISYTDLDGNAVNVTKRLAGENGEDQSYETIVAEGGVYTIEGLKLSENEDFDFDLRLEGTQYLEQGVYVYAPVGGRDVSQTFVGIAEGNRNVDVSMGVTIKFDVDENNKLTAKRSWSQTTKTPVVPPVTPDEIPEETPEDPEIEIPEETVPTTPVDPETPDEPEVDIDIPEEEPPLVDIPEEEPPLADIPDEDTPLADVPETGDVSMLALCLTTLLSGGGLAGLVGMGRKGKEE